jgi:hypothetical protein
LHVAVDDTTRDLSTVLYEHDAEDLEPRDRRAVILSLEDALISMVEKEPA